MQPLRREDCCRRFDSTMSVRLGIEVTALAQPASCRRKIECDVRPDDQGGSHVAFLIASLLSRRLPSRHGRLWTRGQGWLARAIDSPTDTSLMATTNLRTWRSRARSRLGTPSGDDAPPQIPVWQIMRNACSL